MKQNNQEEKPMIPITLYVAACRGNSRNTANIRGTYRFSTPRPPVIESATHDGVGVVTFTIKTDEGKDERERYDTMYSVARQDSANRNNGWKTEHLCVGWTSTQDTTKSVACPDIADALSLSAGQWIKLTCRAYSRGLAGNSETVERTFVFARAAKPAITSITTSGLSGSDIVTVHLRTNASSTAPVDNIKLYRLADVTVSTAAEASLAQGWTAVSGAEDNGVCVGLSDLVSAAMPSVKKHTWYKLVSTHEGLTQESVPVEAKCLYRDKDAQHDDVVKFQSVLTGADGTSVQMLIAWKNDDSNATEVAFAPNEDAWESNQQPTIFDVTWEDDTCAVSGWNHSAHVTIRGLEEGKECYIRARRKYVTSSTTTYGPWCTPAKAYYPVMPTVDPSDVNLQAPGTIERGNGISCSWSFTGSEQTGWKVCSVSGTSRKVLKSGTGATGACTIPASQLKNLSSIVLVASVTTGGKWVESNQVAVSIADAPTLSISVDDTLGAQPLEIGLASNSSTASVLVYVISNGVFTDSPEGTKVQAQGDVVWAGKVRPSWTSSDSAYAAAIAAPSDLKLYDGCSYRVAVTAVDDATGLCSPEKTDVFDVSWEHQATCPSRDSVVRLDEDNLIAFIRPFAPLNAAEDDVCDIYRKTPDGAYLIASDVPFGTQVADRFAPFSHKGTCAYTLCTRTADGDIDWMDAGYTLEHQGLRIDFDGKHVELPYNVSTSDSWEKGFELRQHLDGTQAGYWDAGASRKASISTDVVKVESEEQRRLLAELAKYAGACFVRTADGCAYPADVQVESYGVSYDSGAVPVSISATEVAITDEHKVAPNDWESAGSAESGESS